MPPTPADLSTPPNLCGKGENGTGKSTLLRAISRKCGIYIWEGMARRRYETLFTGRAMGAKYAEVYRRVLARRQAA